MTREKTPKKGRSAASKKQYCSKFVANVLDKLIAKELENVKKHQRTVCKPNTMWKFILWSSLIDIEMVGENAKQYS
jgi:hypothetical protein